MNVKRGRELAKQIQAAGIKKFFTVQTRTDIICRHPELIEMWKDCGNLAKELSNPETFLRGHRESPPELASSPG